MYSTTVAMRLILLVDFFWWISTGGFLLVDFFWWISAGGFLLVDSYWGISIGGFLKLEIYIGRGNWVIYIKKSTSGVQRWASSTRGGYSFPHIQNVEINAL